MNTGNNNNAKSTILVVDDGDAFSTLIQKNLKAKGYKTARTSSTAETIDWLANNKADLMLLDHGLGNTTSKKLIEKLKRQNLQTPFVVVSGQEDEQIAVDMISSGAIDYVVKNAELLDMLPVTVKRVIEKCKHDADLRQASRKLQQEAVIDAHLANVSKSLLISKTIEEISDIILENAKELTGSKFGYAGYIDPETGYLVSPTLTKGIWEKCNVKDKNIIFQEFSGLWGWVLKNKKPLLTNNPSTHEESTGTPAGHIPIKNFLSVPSMIREEVIGQIAVANSERNYTQRDMVTLQRLSEYYAIAIQKMHDKEDLQTTTGTLNSILDSSTEYAIAATDLNFKILHYNPTAEKLFGYTKEDVIGKTIQQMHTKESVEPERFNRAIEAVKRDGKWEYDVTGKDDSGRDLYLHSTVMPLKNSVGEMIGYVLYSKDVTEQRNLVKKIEALAKFPDENPNPVLRIQNDGTVLYGNNASEPLLKEWGCRQGQKLSGKWQQFINDALRSGSPQQIEFDCRKHFFSLTFAPVADANYVNIYALDITEKKKYEEEIQKSYKLMEDKVKERTLQLQKTVKDLQNEVVERIKDEAIIIEDQKQLRKMASELMTIEERERRDIATALHDSIGQILAFSTIELGIIISKADKKSAKLLKKVRHNIEKAITETRKLTYDLSPAVLYSFGLNPALEHLSEQFSMDHNLTCSFETDNETVNISTEVELFLYRAVRELLINTAKHAKAKKAAIKTRIADDNLEISVSDDGQGFDLFSVNVVKGEFNSIGLLSIKERLTHIGGSLKIYSMPGKGTVIRMLTPVEIQDSKKERK